MKPDIPPAPCFGHHDLFDSRRLIDHESAKRICDTCPIISACEKNLADVMTSSVTRGEPEGTWAGRLLGEPMTERGAAKVAPDGYPSRRSA